MNTTQITFNLPDTESEFEFLREYMVPAWERFEESDAFESGWFWPAGNFARHEIPELSRERHDLERLEQGMITFIITGDPDTVIETEREYWQAFEEDGLLTGWECQPFQPTYENIREKMQDKYGRVGGQRAYELRAVAAAATVDCLERFDERLPAVGEATDENPAPIAFWAVIHFMMKHQGYDWDEEIDACTKTIESRLQSMAMFRGEEVAREKRDAVLDALEAATIEV